MPEDEQPHAGTIRSLILIIVLIACGVGAAGFLYMTREEVPRRGIDALPPVVQVLSVELEDVTEWFVGYGSALPDRTVTVSSEVSGRIIERINDIEAGSVVNEGQPLFRIDDREYLLTLERVRALVDVDRASTRELIAEESNLKKLIRTAEHEVRVTGDERTRVSGLFEQGSAAKKEFDFANLAYQRARRVLQGYEMELAKIGPRRERVEASIRSRQAEAKLAELNIERCEVLAPLGGVIQALFAEAGDRVAVGTPLMTIIDPSQVEIPIQLSGSVYDQVTVGTICRLKCESMPRSSWEGRVVRIAPDVDERTRTFSAYLEVDNSQHEIPLVPGMFVTAEVRGPSYGGRLLVPRGAIRDGSVLVAENGHASRRIVSAEQLIGDRAIVSGDLHAGDDVIVSHLGQLEDGSPVRVREILSGAGHGEGSLEFSGALDLDVPPDVRIETKSAPGLSTGGVSVSP